MGCLTGLLWLVFAIFMPAIALVVAVWMLGHPIVAIIVLVLWLLE